MTLVPFAYTVRAYDSAIEEDGDVECEEEGCERAAAFVFEGRHEQLNLGMPLPDQTRVLHYCREHAREFAAKEELALPVG